MKRVMNIKSILIDMMHAQEDLINPQKCSQSSI